MEPESGSFLEKDFENELVNFGLRIGEHQDKIRLLECQQRYIESNLLDLKAKNCIKTSNECDAASRNQTPRTSSYDSPTKNEITTLIESKSNTAAALVLKFLREVSDQDCYGFMGHIIGVVALLGTTPTLELSRIFAKYLGDQMLAVVCKSYEDVRLLETYEKLNQELGQSINGLHLGKCCIMGVGVHDREVQEFANTFKCSRGSIPFHYLGMPVGGGMSRIASWDILINKFQSKLSNWKARNLSFGGRLVLCKSVLGSLGTYLFSLYKAPENVLHKLESIRRRFFWGGNFDIKKMNWIAWKKALNSNSNGGLNIGSLKALNLALLGKWWWRFFNEPNALWHKVITSIHDPNGNLGGATRSGCWGCISRLHTHIDLGNTDFRNLFYESDDRMEWGLEDNGSYTVASLRKVVDEHILDVNTHPTIWFKSVPRKVNILLWRASCSRLPTRSNLILRGIQIPSPLCPLCNRVDETESHLFLECSFVADIYRLMRLWYPDFIWNVNDIFSLLSKIGKGMGFRKPLSEIVHLAFFYVIWGYRNDVVHLGKPKCALEILCTIKCISFSWFSSRIVNAASLNWDIWACEASKDVEGNLILPNPTLPDGTTPAGFLGYAVNMIDIDYDHLNTMTNSGYGLCETLFYRLFGETQVYESKQDMKRAISCIKDGAVSLDGGILRGNGAMSFGCWEPDIIFRIDATRKEVKLKLMETMDQLIKEKESLESTLKNLEKIVDKYGKYFMWYLFEERICVMDEEGLHGRMDTAWYYMVGGKVYYVGQNMPLASGQTDVA